MYDPVPGSVLNVWSCAWFSLKCLILCLVQSEMYDPVPGSVLNVWSCAWFILKCMILCLVQSLMYDPVPDSVLSFLNWSTLLSRISKSSWLWPNSRSPESQPNFVFFFALFVHTSLVNCSFKRDTSWKILLFDRLWYQVPGYLIFTI